MAPVPTNHNAVDFLLDGQRFFAELKVLFDQVQHAVVNANTYLRMASWSADLDCPIGAPGHQVPLHQALTAVAHAGHQVDLILWCPSRTDRMGSDMAQAVYTGNQLLHTRLHNTEGGRLRVFLEEYNGWVGTATHQKMAIASVAGQRTALLGGVNLEELYNANAAHHPMPQHFWHDSALRLRGPSTTDVEAEWVRRWTKSGLALVANATEQTQHMAVGGGPVSVTIATTNTESRVRVNDIRDRLVAAIGTARDYVYLENYAICDPAIITALRTRMIAVPRLQVILVVPYTLAGDAYPYRYLMRHTWLKLASAHLRSISVSTRGPLPRNILRASRPLWSVREDHNAGDGTRSFSSTFANRWLENDAFVLRGGGQPEEVIKLVDILDIETDFRLYAPIVTTAGDPHEIYVHSKLALIDDRILVVGSSNWTYRSMVYDGEIAAFIENAHIATRARRELFDHYNPPANTLTPATWAAQALANEGGLGAMAAGRHVIVPVPAASFQRTLPTHSGNFTWY